MCAHMLLLILTGFQIKNLLTYDQLNSSWVSLFPLLHVLMHVLMLSLTSTVPSIEICNVCEHTCSEIIFVYDTVLVDIHEFEALPIHFKLVIGESTRPFAGPLALALTHDASPFTRQTLILTTADT